MFWSPNNALIAACRKKSQLLKKFTKNRTHENLLVLKQFRNQLKSSLRKEERKYYLTEFTKRTNNLKATWTLINEILHREKNTSSKSSSPSTLLIDNKQYTTPTDIADKLNVYFTSIGKSLSDLIPPTSTTYQSYLSAPNPHTFTLYPTDSSEVFNLLSELDSSSSQGDDQLSASVIKSIATEISLPLSLIINHSFAKAVFPDSLKLPKFFQYTNLAPKLIPLIIALSHF
jgi:hypothetical protein